MTSIRALREEVYNWLLTQPEFKRKVYTFKLEKKKYYQHNFLRMSL